MKIKEQSFYNKNILPRMRELPLEAVSGEVWSKIDARLTNSGAALAVENKNIFTKLTDIITFKVFIFSAALTVFLMVVSFNYYQNIQAARYLNARLASIALADHYYAENYYYQSLY